MKISAQTDSSLLRTIDSTVVAARKRSSPISVKAETKVDIEGLAKLPGILGSSDPLRFIRLLPSVQTGSEIDAGIHIQGCDHSHNLISIDGTPIYGASHLLGIFSVFNPAHFGTMNYGTTAGTLGRLGGYVDMLPDRSIPSRSTKGDFSLGLVAAQGNLKLRTGDNSALSLSARRSFLNELYRSFLTVDEDPFLYGFGDVNLGWAWAPSAKDRIYADAFYSSDAADYTSIENHLGVKMGWSNASAALHWQHRSAETLLKQSIFITQYSARADISYSLESGFVPYHTRNAGYKTAVQWQDFDFGADILYYDILPPSPVHESGSMTAGIAKETQQALESRIIAAWSRYLSLSWKIRADLAGGWYLSPEKESFWQLDPSLAISYDMFRAGKLDLRAGSATQNIFLTGVSSMGFPIEFNFLAGKYGSPQRSLWASLAYNLYFRQEAWAFSAELYWRRLRNQVEYTGTLMDYLRADSSLADMLTTAEGWNYGINLILHKQAGKLTGWLSASLGRSLRQGEDGSIWPSNFERLIEVNAVATWTERKWDAGGTFIAASGTPFTAPQSFYLLDSRLICLYGPRNGARLAPYIRLDLNFNWYFRKDTTLTHGINFSLYNALARNNELSYRFYYREDGSFAYAPFSFALRLMPGIGWFCKF